MSTNPYLGAIFVIAGVVIVIFLTNHHWFLQ